MKIKKLLNRRKPKKSRSNLAVTEHIFLITKSFNIQEIKTSKRGELEIVDLLNIYKRKNKLSADLIGRGGSWLDTGNIKDFGEASNFISAIENRQGLKIACLEEIAFKNNWIRPKDIRKSIIFMVTVITRNF